MEEKEGQKTGGKDNTGRESRAFDLGAPRLFRRPTWNIHYTLEINILHLTKIRGGVQAFISADRSIRIVSSPLPLPRSTNPTGHRVECGTPYRSHARPFAMPSPKK
jgi:hypothetical protein